MEMRGLAEFLHLCMDIFSNSLYSPSDERPYEAPSSFSIPASREYSEMKE